MKKLLTFSALVASVLIGCNSTHNNEFVLKGKDLPADLKYLLIEDYDNHVVDSIPVKNGEVDFTSANIDTTSILTLSVGQQKIAIFKEPGVVTLQSDSANGVKLVGSKYFDRLQKFLTERTSYDNDFQTKAAAIISDSTKTSDEKTSAYNDLQEKYHQDRNAMIRSWYEKNKDNTIGFVAFMFINFDTDSAFVAEYDKASKTIQNFPRLKEKYNAIKKTASTSVGHDYVDVAMVDAKGDTVKISSFKKPNRYLLIDFWASWCGPCKAAMPHLADLNKKYAKKGLDILSIGTSDKPADNEAAAKKLNIVWNHLCDTQNLASKEYGVRGIPTLILISPEGKIIARTHIPDEINSKIVDALGK